METLGIYLLKMLICSAVLYGYYRAALFNERFHQWNRFYLLAAMVLSVVVPFVNIPIFTEQPAVVTAVSAMPWNMASLPIVAQQAVEPSFTWQNVLAAAGLAISLVLIVRILISVARLFIAYRQNPVSRMDEQVQLVVTELNNAPFSFFNWLFWRQDIDPESANGQRMLAHELTHIRECHSFDKLFTELLLCVFWMNPFFWLMRKELDMIHEFLADRKAIGRQDGKAFAEMILQAIHVQPQYAMTNPFFSSQIKRRLLMITTSKTPQFTYLRRVSGLVVMIASATILTLTVQQAEAQKQEKKAAAKKKAVTNNKLSSDRDWEEAATGKRNPADTLMWISSIGERKMLKTADGTTIVADSIFYNSTTGELVAFTPSGDQVKIKSSLETINKLNHLVKSGDFKQIKVLANTSIAVGENAIHYKIDESDNPPLYILDGKEISVAQLKTMNPENIQQVAFLTGENVTTVYGDKGKNGVVMLKSKETLVKMGEVIVTAQNAANSSEPLYIVEGKRVSSTEFHATNPNNIAEVNVLKDQNATDKYGASGKNGVIEIKLKPAGGQLNTKDKLQGDVVGVSIDKKADGANKGLTVFGNDKPTPAPLYILNGVTVDEKTIENIPPDDVESLNMLKGESAKSIYGEKAKNGVVLITTKVGVKDNNAAATTVLLPHGHPRKPLFIIDGKEISSEEMPPVDRIERLNMLKGKDVFEKYGQKAKDGVIEIILKADDYSERGYEPL
jgi:TonB-dependent SusC/RagA subfamily outer membrane receptor